MKVLLNSRLTAYGYANHQPPTTNHQPPTTNHTMINTLVLYRSTKTFTHVSASDLISDHCARPSEIIWVDVADPTSRDFDELAREFGFHPLSIEDCRHQH